MKSSLRNRELFLQRNLFSITNAISPIKLIHAWETKRLRRTSSWRRRTFLRHCLNLWNDTQKFCFIQHHLVWVIPFLERSAAKQPRKGKNSRHLHLSSHPIWFDLQMWRITSIFSLQKSGLQISAVELQIGRLISHEPQFHRGDRGLVGAIGFQTKLSPEKFPDWILSTCSADEKLETLRYHKTRGTFWIKWQPNL